MCYTVTKKSEPAELSKVYQRPVEAPELDRQYFMVSGFSHPKLPVIASERPDVIQHFTWGLIPAWCKNEEQAEELAKMTLNARSETVFEKSSFRSIKKKRCIIPVNGFFEWLAHGKEKYPHYIYLKERPLFSLGGLYDSWMNQETGELINTFSIVTTEANPMMARIHNQKKRMPLILSGEAEELWLQEDVSKEFLADLMRPYDENLMSAHSVSKRITSRKDNPNVPETLEPFEYPELALL
jgi:putative SOS response-associated peptidase YedK